MKIIAQFKFQTLASDPNSQLFGFIGTVMHWNEKYILKLEIPGFEQTYKFTDSPMPLDEVTSAASWEKFFRGPRGTEVLKMFSQMQKIIEENAL